MKNEYFHFHGPLCDVSNIRKILDKYFERNNSKIMGMKDICANLDILNIIFSKNITDKISTFAGHNYITLGEFSILKNSYSPNGDFHRDNQGDLRDQHNNSEYNVYTVGIYFQDNVLPYGGGLDIIPKSYKIFLSFLRPDNILFRLVNRFFWTFFGQRITLSSKAGDLLAWNRRLMHKATASNAERLDNKYLLVWHVASETVFKANSKYILDSWRHRSNSDEYYSEILELKRDTLFSQQGKFIVENSSTYLFLASDVQF